jgi:NhaP-type Na+/H+ or K+/H+ antiporter
VLVGIVVTALVAGAGRLPSDTHVRSLVIRALVGLTVGVVLTVFVRRMLGALGAAPPAAPQTVEAGSADIVYECAQCGTRLRLEVASTGKAPKHCGEEMEPRLAP